MLRFDAAAFFWLASALEVREDTERMKGDIVLSAEEHKEERESFKKMAETCRELELRFTVKYIEHHILEDLKEPNFKHAQLASMIYQLRDRIADELNDKVFIHVEDLKYYEEKNLFGEAVSDKLPQLTTDIEEAGKCLALARATATVFHLMRVMEIGVQELGSKLGVTLTQEKNWQTILNQISSAIKSLPEGTPEEKKQKSLYAQAASHLFNVKLAWRNPVMHPKDTYTEEEAEDIFVHAKTFIRHLVNEVLV